MEEVGGDQQRPEMPTDSGFCSKAEGKLERFDRPQGFETQEKLSNPTQPEVFTQNPFTCQSAFLASRLAGAEA